VSGEDASGPGPSGGRDAGDDAAWEDLVARFDMPAAGQAGEAPWPDRESLTPTPRDQGAASQLPGAERARVIRPAAPSPAAPPPSRPPGADADASHADRADAGQADLAGADLAGADLTGRAARAGAADARAADPGTAASDTAGPAGADEGADEHFVPPPPPPLPHLDSVAKGAWTALFGGPAYLLWATLMGWVVPGWAALLAVMAFVGGFAVIVLRLGDRPSRGAGSDDDDDGAVL
jgi:hypothetical protein